MKQTTNSLVVFSACALTLSLTMIASNERAEAQISLSITLAPPALPVYEQPVLAEEGWIWAPGYWDYNQDAGYFWVPGTWVQPPEVGLLWTPGYWRWGNGGYAWNDGYWGSTVGFYGGIAYGFGYPGHGYTGGHWQGQHFYYNTAVSRVNVTNIHNTYTQTIVNNTTVSRVSFNGGTGGVTARPTAEEQVVARATHQPATPIQMQHRQAAMANHALSASVNHGKPPVAATPKPAELNGPGIVKASGPGIVKASGPGTVKASGPSTVKASGPGTVKASGPGIAKASSPGSPKRAAPRTVTAAPAETRAPVHAADLPPVAHQAAPTTGNVERDKVNQQKQNDLRDSQEKQRQELQQKQAADHELAAKQSSTSASAKELERQHQTQTQALAQRHTTEQKALQGTQEKKAAGKGEPETQHHTSSLQRPLPDVDNRSDVTRQFAASATACAEGSLCSNPNGEAWSRQAVQRLEASTRPVWGTEQTS